jgi:hypothetical protein
MDAMERVSAIGEHTAPPEIRTHQGHRDGDRVSAKSVLATGLRQHHTRHVPIHLLSPCIPPGNS